MANNKITNYKLQITAIILTILLYSGVYAQDRMKFDHVFDLGVPGGQTFLQDNDGFLWIGSDGGGMFRYDGYELKNYKPGPRSLSNGNVWRIIEDKQNRDIFWIGTSGGLNQFDKRTETFIYYKHNPNNPDSLGNNTIQDIVQDSINPEILWLGTSGGGLNKFNKKTQKFTRYEHNPDNPDSITFPDVWRIIEDRQNSDILWIGTYGGGLDKFEKSTQTFTHYVHEPDNPNSLGSGGNNVDAIIQDKEDPDILWIGTPEDGMDKFNTITEQFTHYPAELTNGEVALIYDDGFHRLWLGGYVMNNGLTLFDKRTRTFTNYKHTPNDPRSLSDDLVVNVYEDRSGIFWITTYSGKIDKIDRKTQNFTLYKNHSNIPGSLSNSAVTAMYQDRAGVIWIGTQSGLNRFHPETEMFTSYVHTDGDPHSLDVDYILGMYEDISGDFWVSLYVGPLVKFDRKTGEVAARYKSEAESLTKIIQEPHNPNILWMGTHMAGLAKFDKSSETFTFYPPDPEHPRKGPGNTYVQEIIYDRDEEVLWLGGYFGGGLNKFDRHTEQFTHYLSNPNNPQTLSADAIAAIYQDMSGTLWIGTKGGGLNKFDKAKGIFTHYTRKHGVPTEVNGILEDNAGKLWLSSNEGIVLFNPKTGKVERRYDKSDGLQGNAFLDRSALKTTTGVLWFGGTNGANCFHPDRLVRNLYEPPVVLTALTQGGESLSPGIVPSRLKHIRLNWQRNFFEFEFAALNYTIPEKNQYKYMLEGFDRNWYDSKTKRFGRYSNLPGGNYMLRVMGTNNDGVWSNKSVSLNVIVTPPWWETTWFRILVIVLAMCAVFGGAGWKIRAVKVRARVLEKQVAERTAALTEKTEELAKRTYELMKTNDQLEIAREKADAANESKSTFLANMSHELRSPLTAIMGFAQIMRRDRNLIQEYQQYLDIIHRSGEHLLALINQVLDLAKIEAGRIVLNKKNFDLHRMLCDVEDMFRMRAEEKRLQFLFEPAGDIPRYICTDEVKLRQVLINLLNNALKFTETGGVMLRIGNLRTEGSQHSLSFEIEDTGPGIAQNEISSLFESFVQTETGRRSQEGTGLGLPISRKFVQLMGGDMKVFSRLGAGTTFSFHISYEPADHVEEHASVASQVIAIEPGQPRYRILIADDKENNRQLLIKLLNPLGFELREAINGKEVIDIWSQWKPHLVWMDIRMPVMDGCEATRKIRKLEASFHSQSPASSDQHPATSDQHTSIIALSASVLEDERKEVLASGCDDFIRKPFRENDIFEIMRKHIGVKYIYESEAGYGGDAVSGTYGQSQDEEKTDRVNIPDSLSDLPSDLLTELENATEGGDVEMIDNMLSKIQFYNPELTDNLRLLSNDFAYDEILRLIQEARLLKC